MTAFTINSLLRSGINTSLLGRYQLFSFQGRKCIDFISRKALHATPCSGPGAQIVALAWRKSERKLRNDRKLPKPTTVQSKKISSEDCADSSSNLQSGPDGDYHPSAQSISDNLDANSPMTSATRSVVLQACIVTSGVLLAFGSLLRQATHIASAEGWAIPDASTEISFGFEMWHIELVIGLITLITSCRYILLKTWPDFAESSEAANQQVLSSLEPLDYVVVAFLPGISEELLFRGALLPLFGLNWKSALVVGAIFGGLHLGNGRRYSFAAWATFVGFAYGLTTVISSSVIVPMASHSLNNLIGGILWRYTSNSLEKKNTGSV